MISKKMEEINYYYFEFKNIIMDILEDKEIESKYIYDEEYNKNISLRTLTIRDVLYNTYNLFYEFVTNKESSMTLEIITIMEEIASEYSKTCNKSYSETLLDSIFKAFEFECSGKGVKKEYPFIKDLKLNVERMFNCNLG